MDGVRDDLYLNSIELDDNIYKLLALQNLDEYLNLNTNTINSNEYEFGTVGQDDPSDLNVVKNTLYVLLITLRLTKKLKDKQTNLTERTSLYRSSSQNK